ncbi:hypothetical protein HNR55_002530 [Acetobacter lovaniensis]|uniref:Uncharacterized protein n=1 Tax=Acetobacter lovaniensis TaxID=104100 RepID=A0A841QHL7_9PROT|nr:hypothetical protein [Acetobacter lovaniensis]
MAENFVRLSIDRDQIGPFSIWYLRTGFATY